MSLKAKIEAVIYASEEPVTLPQLVSLLGVEAQAELDAFDARQGRLALHNAEAVLLLEEGEAGDEDALNAETLGLDDFSAAEPLADEEYLDSGEDEPQHPDSSAFFEEPRVDARDGDSSPGEDSGSGEAIPSPAPSPDPASGSPTDGTDVTPDPAGDAPAEAQQNPPAEPWAAPPVGERADEADPTPPTSAGTTPAPNTTPNTTPSPTPSPAETRAGERRLREYMQSVLEALVAEYREGDRGLEIREIASGYRFATKPEYHDAVRGFVRSLKPPLKLSLQALETLAVVAYKQPVTAPEVSEVRGVDSGGVLGSLMARKLVTTAGRKQVIGRPILYKTTKEFLLRFGLKDINELPSIEEFERLASDLNEAVQEEIPMADSLDTMKPTGTVGDAPRALEPMRDVHAAQADGVPDDDSNAVPDQQSDSEHTSPAAAGPGEFTGNETVPPADNVTADGRLSGVPPNYDSDTQPEAGIDSPALDAEVQRNAEQMGNAGSDD